MKKNIPTMQETRVQSLSQEDPLEKELATHSSVLAQRIPWTEKPGGLQSKGSQSRTRLSTFKLQQLEGTVPSTLPSLLTSITSWEVGREWVSKTSLSFSNSLEGLKELLESCYTHSYGLLQGKEEHPSKEQMHRAESKRVTSTNLLLSSPMESGCITLPGLICHNTQCSDKQGGSPVLWCFKLLLEDFPGGPVVKNPPADAGDMGSTLGLGRFRMPQGS